MGECRITAATPSNDARHVHGRPRGPMFAKNNDTERELAARPRGGTTTSLAAPTIVTVYDVVFTPPECEGCHEDERGQDGQDEERVPQAVEVFRLPAHRHRHVVEHVGGVVGRDVLIWHRAGASMAKDDKEACQTWLLCMSRITTNHFECRLRRQKWFVMRGNAEDKPAVPHRCICTFFVVGP